MANDGFHVVDYVLFALTLAISLAIGIYYSCVGGKQKSTKEYFLGDKKMKAIPVAFSLFMSYISAVLVLGNTAEMYTAGIQYWLAAVGSSLAFLFSAQVFVPFFYKLQLTSSFEYFEERFDSKLVKLWSTVMFLISSIVYMGLVMFTPATALKAATGFPVWASIIGSGLVSTVYTTLGGMKAVIWTDFIQGIILIAGILAVVIIGVIDVGGLTEVWNISKEGGRLDLWDFNADPTQRLSFWSVIIGRFFISLNMVGTGQTSIQRYSTLASLRDAQLSTLLNCPAILIVYSLTCLMGLVVYAYYAAKGCDPLANGEIESSNQLLPYFIMEVINYPGIPGIFLAVLFSGALSSLSSSLNSMSACTWKDILEWKFKNVSTNTRSVIIKATVAVYGLLAVGMAFLAEGLGGHVLQATNSLVSGMGGPSLGMFVLGSFFPWTNWQGAFFGSVIGFAFSTWVSVGAYVTKPSTGRLDTSTENCINPYTTDTWWMSTTQDSIMTTYPTEPEEEIFALYRLSYMYTAMFGALITLVCGLIISLITGPVDPTNMNPKLFNPVVEKLCCCLPARWRRRCWCGVHYTDKENSPEGKYEAEINKSPLVDPKYVSNLETISQKVHSEDSRSEDVHVKQYGTFKNDEGKANDELHTSAL